MENNIKVWLADIHNAIIEIYGSLPEKKVFS